MSGSHSIVVATVLATALAWPGPGRGHDIAQFESLSLRSAEGDAARAVRIPAMLTLPSGWMPGDAAVVVVGDHAGAEPARDRLVGLLLGEGAATLELDVHTPRGVRPTARPTRCRRRRRRWWPTSKPGWTRCGWSRARGWS